MNLPPLKTAEDAPPQPLGDFKPVDEWQAHLNAVFYGLRATRIREYYQTLASADFRLAHALAVEFYDWYRNHKALPARVMVQEWGCGNGNLAACFLSHVKTLDRVLYGKIAYVLVDNNKETVCAALGHPDLQLHKDRVFGLQADVQDLAAVKEQTVQWIHCNELWSDLPTKVMLRKEGDIAEEQMRPNLSDAKTKDFPDWFSFVKNFGAKDVTKLKDEPAFLDEILWEKDYQPVDWKRVPYRKTIAEFLKPMDDLVLVPVNVGAFATIKEAKRVLVPGGRFTSFDAGTADPHTLGSADKPCYSLLGGQYSFIVNFALCDAIARYLGVRDVSLEPQKEFVSRTLGKNVVTLVDILNTYPFPGKLRAWERDHLVVQTLQVLSGVYTSPYRRQIDYPLRPDTPEPERTAMVQVLANLPATGIPDTIAYLSEDEVLQALPGLEALGFPKTELQELVRGQLPPDIDYYRFSLVA